MTEPPRRLALVISSLRAGGAERVMTILAEAWARRGDDVTLVTLDSGEADFYVVPAGVARVALGVLADSRGKLDAIRRNVARLWAIRRAIRQARPDVVVSFTDVTNVMVLLAMLGSRTPIVVSERVDPRRMPIGGAWARLRRWLYPRASALVMQAEALRAWGEELVQASRVFVVPNPARLPEPAASEAGGPAEAMVATLSQGKARLLVAMGRLDRQKGFDLLIPAFAEARRRVAAGRATGEASGALEEWKLVILGEGAERPTLEALAAEEGLKAGHFAMPGVVTDPFPMLRAADAFVMSSRFEGFPNALVEAMACGCAVASTDCPTGPREIIEDGVDGLLVAPEDIEALTGAMVRLMGNAELRQRLASAAPRVADRFSEARVLELWDKVMHAAISGR